MAKVKIVQIAIALSEDGEDAQYLDGKGRVWYQVAIPDEDKCEYDEIGRRTKSVFKNKWIQMELPDEPGEELN